ncbi:MAG: DUF2723 domain-containing protein [Planctomycetota bacterium]
MSRNRLLLSSAVLGIAALGLYWLTLHPGAPAGDSGELIAVSHRLGVAHPPGYPLYTILAKGFASLTPVGSIAFRLNLLSALTNALAVALLCHAIGRWTGSVAAGLVSGGLLATSLPFWKYAIVAEVFALNNLMAALLIWAFLRMLRAMKGDEIHPGRAIQRCLLGMALLTGLTWAHHHTLIIIAGPVLGWSVLLAISPFVRELVGLSRDAALRPPALLLQVTVCLLAGLLPLLYLPWAASREGWPLWGDPTTLRGFLWILARGDYGTLSLAPESKKLVADFSHFGHFLASILPQFGWIGGLYLAAAVSFLVRRPSRGEEGSLWTRGTFAFALPLAVSAGGFWAFFGLIAFPANPPVYLGVVERFHILPGLILAVVMGLGAARLFSAIQRPWAIVMIVIVTLSTPIALHFEDVQQRDNTFTEDLGRALLASTPKNAVLFTRGDLLTNSITALQTTESLRTDVLLIDQELMTYDWYVRYLRQRHPGLLPPLDRVQRLSLRTAPLQGRVLAQNEQSIRIATASRITTIDRGLPVQLSALPDGQTQVTFTRDTIHGSLLGRDVGFVLFQARERSLRIDETLVKAIEDADTTPAEWHRALIDRPFWAPEVSPDRYSGLPGTQNIHWIDHLIESRPVCFAGWKETSFQLRYQAVPHGLVMRIYPREEAPTLSDRLERTLSIIGSISTESFFREYDPWSFEHQSRFRFHHLMVQGALLLASPAGKSTPAAHPVAKKVVAFLERELRRQDETGEHPPWWIDTRRALGLLLAASPAFEDLPRATQLLREYQEAAPAGSEGEQDVRAMLDYLEKLGH